MGVPGCVSPVAHATSSSGCSAHSRSNSAPVYPDAPAIPTVAIERSYGLPYEYATRWVASGAQLCLVRRLDGVDAAAANLPHLVVGQGALEGVEPEPEREAAAAGAQLDAAEHIEQAQLHEQLSPGDAQRLLDGARGHRVVDDDGEVDLGGREPAHRLVGLGATAGGKEPLAVDLRP